LCHTADGSSLSVARHDTLSSNSFHVPDVSLVPDLTMQLMSAGQIADHDCRVILDPDVYYIQDRRIGHLVGTGPIVVIRNVFGSLSGFILLPLRPLVLSAPPVLCCFIHVIICSVALSSGSSFCPPDYLLCFVEAF
jgi:hypothetical protein